MAAKNSLFSILHFEAVDLEEHTRVAGSVSPCTPQGRLSAFRQTVRADPYHDAFSLSSLFPAPNLSRHPRKHRRAFPPHFLFAETVVECMQLVFTSAQWARHTVPKPAAAFTGDVGVSTNANEQTARARIEVLHPMVFSISLVPPFEAAGLAI